MAEHITDKDQKRAPGSKNALFDPIQAGARPAGGARPDGASVIPEGASAASAAPAVSHWTEAGASDRGPFAPRLNHMLSAAFGQPLDGLSVARGEDHRNQSLGAKAHTMGQKISLGSGISEDPADGHSMEIIGHEVAHALGKGSGKHAVDRPGDPGEAQAHDAGRGFRGFAQGGALPRLQAAHGGQAAIHRFEAGEHKDAVDSAVSILQDEKKAGQKGAPDVDPTVAAQMGKKIKLANGLEVTPGEVCAMMGDFYGAFDKDKDGKEHFNPGKSFDALNNADPKEMQNILNVVRKEHDDVEKAKAGQGKFEATDSGTLEGITKYRNTQTDKDGTTTGYSMLELAQRNTAHFSKKDTSGFDNNLGAYQELHRLALEAAAKGDANQARALEASSMHFLTDRFAGGHLFDKEAIMAQGGGGLRGNIVSRMVHNDYNEKGAQVTDGAGQGWLAKGDEHWADADNKDNRFHAASAVYSSYSDMEAVLAGKKTPDQARKESAVGNLVPQWDDKREQAAEKEAGSITNTQIAKTEVPEAPGALWGEGQRLYGEGANWAGDKWDGVKTGAGKAWDATTQAAGHAWDATTQTASNAYQGAKTGVSSAWHTTEGAVSSGWDWLKKKVGR